MSNQHKQANNKGKSKKEVISFEIEKDLVTALKEKASGLERSMSAHLRKLVKDDLTERKAA